MTATPGSLRVRCVTLLSCLVLASWLTACGDGQTPAEAVPALQSDLDAVDEAVASGDDAAVRRSLEALADQTVRAQDAGAISDDQGDRILRAISDLEAELPGAATTPSSSPTPPPSEPTSTPASDAPAPDTTDDDDTEDPQDDDGPADPGDEGKGKEKGKDEDKAKDKGKGKDD